MKYIFKEDKDMFNSNCNTASVPLVANIDGGCNRNDGMFGGDGWWAIIIFALIFGWGGNGFGWGGNNGQKCKITPPIKMGFILKQHLVTIY